MATVLALDNSSQCQRLPSFFPLRNVSTVTPCSDEACPCKGSGGMLLMIAGVQETDNFAQLHALFSKGCLTARVRDHGPMIGWDDLPNRRLASHTASTENISFILAYKEKRIMEFSCTRLFDDIALSFSAHPAKNLDTNSFSVRSESERHQLALLLQPPSLLPIEIAVTTMVPGEPTTPALLLMEDGWALGGTLARFAMEQQKALWRQRDESSVTSTTEKPQNSLLKTQRDSPLSMAKLFRRFADRRSSRERRG